MALLVEDGTGLANANAYISVAEMQAYFALVNVVISAGAATEAAIVAGCRYIELRWGGRFRGRRVKYYQQQALSWPRYCAYDDDGQLLPSDAVPSLLKSANAEYANRALVAPLAPDPLVDASGLALSFDKKKVGPLEIEKHFAGGSPALWKPLPAADAYLRQLVWPGGGVERG